MQRTLWDGVENRCQNKKLGRFIFLLYCGWGFKISIWTGNSLDLVECQVRSHQGTWWFSDAKASSLPGDSLWSQGMLGTQRAKWGMGIRVRTGFVVVSFPPNIYCFPFLIHSASTSWLLYAWHFTGHLGFEDEYRRIPPRKKSGHKFKYWPQVPIPVRRSSSEGGMRGPMFLKPYASNFKAFSFHSTLLF